MKKNIANKIHKGMWTFIVENIPKFYSITDTSVDFICSLKEEYIKLKWPEYYDCLKNDSFCVFCHFYICRECPLWFNRECYLYKQILCFMDLGCFNIVFNLCKQLAEEEV